MSRFIRKSLIAPDTLSISLDFSNLRAPHSLMQRMQEAFELPVYFSGGYDSLNDCMRDLAWLPQRNIRIRFLGLSDLRQRHPQLFADMLENIALYRDYWHGNPQEHKIVRIAFDAS